MILLSTKELAYNIIDNLSEEQLSAFVSLFGLTIEIPNEETQAAMLEADRIANDPNVKGFTNTDDLFKELLS